MGTQINSKTAALNKTKLCRVKSEESLLGKMLNKPNMNSSYAAKEGLVNRFHQIRFHLLIAGLNTQTETVYPRGGVMRVNR